MTTIGEMFVMGGGKLPRTLLVVLKNGKTRNYLVNGWTIGKGGVVVYGVYIETNRAKRLGGDTKVLDLPGVPASERPSFILLDYLKSL